MFDVYCVFIKCQIFATFFQLLISFNVYYLEIHLLFVFRLFNQTIGYLRIFNCRID